MTRLLYALLFFVPSVAAAEVIERSPASFLIKTEVTINVAPDRAYDALVEDIHAWWDAAHTFSGDAGNLWLTPNPGGCLCETLAQGGGVEHAVVIHVVPNEMLRLRGALGPLQEYAINGIWTWNFAPSGRGATTATMTYSVTGTFPGGLDKVADAVNVVLTDQLQRLKRYAETAVNRPVLPIPR